jgi:ribonuclease G
MKGMEMLKFIRGEKKIKREIITNAEHAETRVAVMENGRVEEYEVEHPSEERIVGSIFKGRIQNLEHDLQAAFVDIGLSKNAFLHYWDMFPDDSALIAEETGGRRGKSPRRKKYSNEVVSKECPIGSEIVVQVSKDRIGTKGPRVTANLSIPGRSLVLMPGSKLRGVSRKIENAQERQRLKKMLARLPVPDEVGVIIRTMGLDSRRGGFVRDLRALLTIWEEIKHGIEHDRAPSCLYREPDLIERVVRDWLTSDVDRIAVDNREEFERIKKVAARMSRRARSRIQLYEGDAPIFEHFDVEQQVEEAMRRKVMLKCGGYIIFDETEALIAVDVNTGRYKGSGSQEDAILEVNSEAVEEVARQLRLRNIGGLVIVDLIDMKQKRNQNTVLRLMRRALERDRARTNVLPISQLGLLEMTRQRMEESIQSTMNIDCPYCRGRGHVKSPLGTSVDLQRQISAVMRKARHTDGATNLEVTVHPKILERLRKKDEESLIDLESRLDGKLTFRSDAGRHLDDFTIADAESGKVLYAHRELARE